MILQRTYFLGKEMISAHLVYRNVCKDHLLTKTVAVNTTVSLPTDLQVKKRLKDLQEPTRIPSWFLILKACAVSLETNL
jgi:hypothetical protein